MEKQKNLQDLFLNAARTQRISVNVYLINGLKMVGKVQSFDNYVVLLSSEKGPQLIYKHAISTFTPSPDFRFDPIQAAKEASPE